MKKRMIALMLSTVLVCGSFVFTHADEETTTDATAEITTEAATEPTTEKVTTQTTTVETTTEATTSPATTTTKKTTTSTVGNSFSVVLAVNDSEDLSDELPSSVSDLSFTWDTNETGVATVSSSGKAKGISKGYCTITATATSGNTNYIYTFNVTVVKTNGTTKSFTIKVDDTKDLYNYVDDDYAAKDYTWESSNEKYVTVSSRGLITGKKKGSATITAEYVDDDVKYEYEFKITVSNTSSDDDDDDDEVAVKTSWTIYVETGEKVDISDLLEDDPDDYDWDVDDDDIADINESTGKIQGIEEGTTKIYAEGDDDYTFTVKVNDDYSTEYISVKGGATKDLEDVLDEDIDEYTFKSDRTAVAKVSSSGVVTGVAKGMATIVCEHEDGDIVQVFVTVTSSTSTTTTTTTTTETTTETTTAVVAQVITASAFSDISDRAWAVDSINSMASKGFIVGVGQNKFSPDANCKRCDFAIVLTKILNINEEIALSNYGDIKLGEYYYNYVGVAKDYGIECGVVNGNYRPNDFITREEIMVMVYKGMVSQGQVFNTDTSVLNSYTDSGKIAEENKAAVAALINSGAVTGTSDTTLEADANITRAQMAVLMNNIYNKLN